MKFGASLKFILLVVHLSLSREADRHGVTSKHDDSPVSKEVEEDNLWQIVWVTTFGGVARQKEYSERACTGTLIRYDLVLTLASCLMLDYDDDPFPEAIKIHERPRGNLLYALKVFINPNFYSEDKYVSTAHDFGLIVVERSDQSVFPKLPQRSYNFKDIKKDCVMGGYGEDNDKNLKDNFHMFYINKTEVELFEGRHCSSGVRICLHFVELMPCPADFGTPLICNDNDDDDFVYALYIPAKCTPWPRCLSEVKCHDFYITAFSPVYNVKDWVKQIMDAPTSNLEWLNNPWYVLILCCAVFIFMAGIYYGLVEFLQRTFDPAEGMETQMSLEDDNKDDEESWYESQWVTR